MKNWAASLHVKDESIFFSFVEWQRAVCQLTNLRYGRPVPKNPCKLGH